MEILKFRGRLITRDDVEFIKKLIDDNPELSRRALSVKLCHAWQWYQANGHTRDMVCRSLMLALHRSGHIQLPEIRRKNPNPLANRAKTKKALVDYPTLEQKIALLQAFVFKQVRRHKKEEALFKGLIQAHHYLGYVQPVGEHLKFLIYAGETPIACFAWSSAPRHLGDRDRYIGWSAKCRKNNIKFLAYNTRFLILPWAKTPHLASHLLGRMVRILSSEWEKIYEHPIYFAETFVDTSKFAGTCYYAANWRYIGRTLGLGKDSKTHKPDRTIKDILVYPLHRRFRELLQSNISC